MTTGSVGVAAACGATDRTLVRISVLNGGFKQLHRKGSDTRSSRVSVSLIFEPPLGVMKSAKTVQSRKKRYATANLKTPTKTQRL